MATQQYVITVDFSSSNVGGQGPLLEGGNSLPETSNGLQKLSALFAAIGGGSTPALVTVAPTDVSTGTAGAETITCTQASVADGDTVSVAGHAVTARTSGANPALNEFNIGGSDAECGQNLEAALKAHTYIRALVDITRSTNVVTATQRAITPYPVALAETGIGFVVSGATIAGTQNAVSVQPRAYGGA